VVGGWWFGVGSWGSGVRVGSLWGGVWGVGLGGGGWGVGGVVGREAGRVWGVGCGATRSSAGAWAEGLRVVSGLWRLGFQV